MTASTIIFALLAYPVLLNLPLNFVRISWGYRHGLTPMPAEIEESALVADVVVRVFDYLALTMLVALWLRNSRIPSEVVGFTTSNWRQSTALGALVGIVFSAVLSLLLQGTPGEMLKEPESRGPFAMWCGMQALGSFSAEFWRAFCIVALTRLDLSNWLAILIAAVASGAAQALAGTAASAGAAFYGAVAGFLFIKTGSLIAPMPLSVIVSGYYIHWMRRIARSRLAKVSPFDVTCPLCKAIFDSRQKDKKKGFVCPDCGEKLVFQLGRWDWLCAEFSVFIPPIVLYLWGLRGSALLVASIVGVIVTFYVSIGIYCRISPPELVQKCSELRLTEWSRSRGPRNFDKSK